MAHCYVFMRVISFRMKRFFVLVFLVLIASASFSQVAATVKGELLIQLKQNTTPSDVEKEALEELGILPALKMKEVVSDYMRIWLFTFNEDEIAKKDMIRMMNTLKSVSVAQANHIIEERVVPNDPFFGMQWHHYQANDHDIDSELAWDITTGGVTTNGDSIVVCVVERQGAKWNVPDLIQNHWVNINEIPGNGIDDDNNGYIDDYHGWNMEVNSDVIDDYYHGTVVSSMIGAKGDNATGVVGVNWDVKLMQIQMGNGTESNAIAAYTYPLIMRKLYNQTNGVRGAFVVATNSSWGTNFGQPANAPLWCAMYDSLGTYGVLSCGATANNNVNVDIQGDLPTACPSDYLISVTSTNSSDVKVPSAGYGAQTIDIGAPGNQLYLANNNGYTGNNNGTSYATPCVSGGVALLYSAPCSGFMSLVQNSASVAALQIKDFILTGVDQTDLLITQTLSGGRLNLHNSLLNMLEVCSSCMTPLAVSNQQTPGTLDYTISWTNSGMTENVSLRYRLIGTGEWSEINNITESSVLLPGLLPCSEYEYQLKSFCAMDESDWTKLYIINTDGCCMNPSGVFISSLEQNSSYVIWDDVLAAENYSVEIVDENGMFTELTQVEDNVVYLDFLQPCSAYSVYVYSNCGEKTLPPVAVNFSTPGCGACLDAVYCPAGGGTNTEYIRRVVIGDIDYESTGGNAYTFVDDQTTVFIAGETYPILLYPGFPQGPYNQNFRIWLDSNGDGAFQDPDERIYQTPTPIQTVVDADITIPAGALSGYVRMRVGMRYAMFSTNFPSSCGTWEYGEVEDYCVTIVGTSSVSDMSDQASFLVYPNPTGDVLNLSFDGNYMDVVISIYEINGALILQQGLQSNRTVDVRTLPAGLYSVLIHSGRDVYSARFIKR